MKISGPLVSKIDKALVAELLAIAVRLANKDTKIWGADSEAPTRLNWVDLPVTSRDLLPQLDSLSAWARSNKLDEVILCGMGGSSLAAEVIAKTYNKPLVVLDLVAPNTVNTMPEATLNSVKNTGTFNQALVPSKLALSKSILAKIALAGIDLDKITENLEVDGVSKFEASWLDLMKSVNAIAGGLK